MLKSRCPVYLALTVAIFLGASFAEAQTSSGSSRSNTVSDRLFLAFVEDATIIDRQWWEGQVEYADADDLDAIIARGVVALRPWDDIEVGARMGFGSTDASDDLPDGSGGTDLDLWGKYHMGSDSNDTEYVVGGILTIPTGDDTAGLGDDSFKAGVFGALRYRLPEVIFTANAGVRLNGDGERSGGEDSGGEDLQGEVSVRLGVGLIVPLSDRVSGVGEVQYESDPFEERDEISQALVGMNWRVFNRSMVRGSVSVGLSDDAPDAQFLLGWAARF